MSADANTGTPLTAIKSEQGQVWSRLRFDAAAAAAEEPMLASMLNAAVLRHENFSEALAHRVAEKMADAQLDALQMHHVARAAFAAAPELADQAARDMLAVDERDPAVRSLLQPFLYFKGFHALISYRVAHWLWRQERETLAFHLQSRMSERFAVDIHPAAKLGAGLMIDHASSVVIGETAVVGDDVSILHEVTLGGTGAETGDRHPKIGRGVMIGAGAKVLGNIKVGDYARIAAGSVVLQDVPARCTVAGVPARPVGGACAEPARSMDQTFSEDSAN
ncbi:serine O-acetyltransferase [Alkalicaulis satelles]|uniref:Serine acetyltransferase n=1 Tax=Alkalicaulis satelles TaxID=2609175 RepID=A0A5M6ZAD4_9PROT|nr:serine O-acetyltransferase [Alkalicaulis satelles]KAA5801669.1 serine O-acetyltransferase [Alkalicaulis satelles]